MIFALFLLFGAGLNEDNFQELYLNEYIDIAKAEMHNSGIPASIKLAQGMLESNYGRSELAKKANNHFGIKCGSNWDGKGYYRKDDDFNRQGELMKSCFRVFDSAQESYAAHTFFLKDPKKAYRYGFLFEIPKHDYKAWAHGLKKSGYATDPAYPDKLIYIIEKYNLDQYDNEVLGQMNVADNSDIQPTKKESRIKKSTQNPPPAQDLSDHLKPRVKEVYKNKRINIEVNNGSRYALAYANETVQDFSKRVGITTGDILMYNDHINYPTDELDDNTPVYLELKNRDYEGRRTFHALKKGENLALLSQKYGVRLSTLYTLNRISKNLEPLTGQRISLKKRIKLSQRPACERKKESQFIF